jgi:hypothetical protein
MPLDVAGLTKDIADGLKKINNSRDEKADPNTVIEQQALMLATAFDKYVRGGDVVVEPNIPVSTSGGPTAQTGVTVGPGKGKLQ